jgi:enoyl-CoA hydratase
MAREGHPPPWREAVSDTKHIVVDDPRPKVRRITLNRPEKHNPLSNALRTELYAAVDAADADPDIHVAVIRGAGKSFSAGYDLASDILADQPWHTAGGQGNWARHVVEGHFKMWDLGIPIIAQVHGYCLAGGSELAASCDLVYTAEDAQIGYPPVRLMCAPDMQYHAWLMGMRRAMELMLTGDAISGKEAAEWGFANRALPKTKLEKFTLDQAERIAKIPPELQQINKRSVHRAMEAMGVRNALRSGTELMALGLNTEASVEFAKQFQGDLKKALTERDKAFGDYRAKKKAKPAAKKK